MSMKDYSAYPKVPALLERHYLIVFWSSLCILQTQLTEQ